MTDYVKSTNFAAKDALASGNPSKIVKGAEIDAEFTAIATAISSKLDATAIPVGLIGIWSSSLGTIPTGWQICDGTGGTPDLRDKFIVGAGSTYTQGATGGNASVTLTTSNLPPHTHNGTTTTNGTHSHGVLDPGHTHTYYAAVNGASGLGGAGVPTAVAGQTDLSGTGITIAADGTHNHTFTTDSTGSGTAVDTRPPYYALFFIMKVS